MWLPRDAQTSQTATVSKRTDHGLRREMSQDERKGEHPKHDHSGMEERAPHESPAAVNSPCNLPFCPPMSSTSQLAPLSYILLWTCSLTISSVTETTSYVLLPTMLHDH